MWSEFVNEGVIFGRNRTHSEKYDRSDPIQSLGSAGCNESHGDRFETLERLINETDGTGINREQSFFWHPVSDHRMPQNMEKKIKWLKRRTGTNKKTAKKKNLIKHSRGHILHFCNNIYLYCIFNLFQNKKNLIYKWINKYIK